MPKTKLGAMLSMIDNIDTLTGFFVINKKPSGSKDPFALRRAGFSIVKILIEFRLDLCISDLFTESLKTFNNSSEIIKTQLQAFIIDKLSFILKKEGLRDDILESIISLPDLYEIPFQVLIKRIKDINNINKTEEFKFFLSNFKRLNNIIKANQLEENLEIEINKNLFEGSEEEDIFNITNDLRLEFIKNKDEVEKQETVLKEIIKISDKIDVFFEKTIVNHEDNIIKNNRLMLLVNLRNIITQYSRFSLLED
jgi:glycyl-tRNA synthetase beta chain